jgi:hypothetical protein
MCGEGGNLVLCEGGQCKRSFHTGCVGLGSAPGEDWTCPDCQSGQILCLVCNKAGLMNSDVFKCKKVSCGRFYHPACVEADTRVKWFKTKEREFYCPQHVCEVCKERPAGKQTVEPDGWFLTCIFCPKALHLRCALGRPVRIITYRSMICDKHAIGANARSLDMEAVTNIQPPKRKLPKQPHLNDDLLEDWRGSNGAASGMNGAGSNGAVTVQSRLVGGPLRGQDFRVVFTAVSVGLGAGPGEQDSAAEEVM